MGYTSDITNRVDGKKYLISTAADKKGRGWQTAVLKRKLFGIPDLLHPAMFVGALDEEHARQVHAQVESIVAELPSSEWESAKWKLFSEIVDNAFPEADATDEAQMATLTGQERSRFLSRLTPTSASRLGTDEEENLLIALAAGIIRLAVEDEITHIVAEKEKPSDEMKGLFAFEKITFDLFCIGRFAFTKHTVQKREPFMDDLVYAVGALLCRIAGFDLNEDRFKVFFVTEYNTRMDEFASYPWNREEKDSSRDVGWEHGKKLLKILTPEKDAFKVAALGNMALRGVERLIPLAQEVIEKYEQDRTT
jgi:hypothetical protein